MRVSLGLLVLSACASRSAVPALPSQGGPAWIELESPHFTLWTDTSEDRARELVTNMEHLRQAIIGSSFASFGNESRILAFALRDEDEYHAFGPVSSGGVTVRGNALHQVFIALPATQTFGGEDTTLAHELTHAVMYGVVRHQPRWFAEGIAEYFSTIKLGDASVDVGAAPASRFITGQAAKMVHPVPLRQMFACANPSCINANFYVAAWMLVTYLVNNHLPELTRFMQLLDEGHGAKAFGEVFATPVDELDAEARQWLLHGNHVVRSYKIAYHPFEVNRRVLDDSDVLAVRAVMVSHFKSRDKNAMIGLAADAIRLKPNNLVAHMLAAGLGRKPTAAEGTRLTQTMPDDWRAWFILFQATQDRAALARLCQLASTNPAIELKSCEAPPATKPLTEPPPPTQGPGVPSPSP